MLNVHDMQYACSYYLSPVGLFGMFGDTHDRSSVVCMMYMVYHMNDVYMHNVSQVCSCLWVRVCNGAVAADRGWSLAVGSRPELPRFWRQIIFEIAPPAGRGCGNLRSEAMVKQSVIKATRGSRKRFSEADRIAMYGDYRAAKASKVRGAVKAACAKWGCSDGYIRKIFNRMTKQGTLASKPGRGRPSVITPEVADRIKKCCETADFETTIRQIAAEVPGVSKSSVHRYLNKAKFKRPRRRYVPRLTAKHREARIAFAREHRRNTWLAHVDVDEKWFKKRVPRTLLAHPDSDTSEAVRIPVQSKRFVPKIMYLTAIAKPDDRQNGLISIQRAAKDYVAKRSSKYHAKGDVYKKDCTIDKPMYLEMMKRVVTQIRRKMQHHPVVTIQMDNASPHHIRTALEAHISVTHRRTFPELRLMWQPPQSPDMNANDLGFYRSFDAVVQRARGRHFDKAAIHSAVMKAWETYDSSTLHRIFDTKTAVLQKVILADGGNNYDLHHHADAQ